MDEEGQLYFDFGTPKFKEGEFISVVMKKDIKYTTHFTKIRKCFFGFNGWEYELESFPDKKFEENYLIKHDSKKK
jgi:hypothetical protein